MTLLGAIRTSNGILVASDGMSAQQFGGVLPLLTQHPTAKLQKMSGRELVLGCAGHGATFTLFQKWLDAQPQMGWDALAVAAGQQLSDLNGQALRNHLAALGGLQGRPNSHPYSEVLIAGRIDNELDALMIGMDGAATPLGDEKERFVGSGHAGFAAAAWEVLKRSKGPENVYDEPTFRLLFEALAEFIVTLGPPIMMWEIDGAGARPVISR